jgi:hypothetical protein
MSAKYSHTFNFVASLDSDFEKFENVPASELIGAMQRRLASLSAQEAHEVFELLKTIVNSESDSLGKVECEDLPSEGTASQLKTQ